MQYLVATPVSVLKTPVPPSDLCCVHAELNHTVIGTAVLILQLQSACPMLQALQCLVGPPPPYPKALLAVSPVLASYCSAVQSFCVHSLLGNAAAALPSGVAAGPHA